MIERTPEPLRRGLVYIFTGDGKGKTSAALGVVLRALGHGMKVHITYFMKGDYPYGERAILSKLPNITMTSFGSVQFIDPANIKPEEIEQAGLAIKAARDTGKFLLEALPKKRDIDKKGVVDIVTEADRQAEKMIFEIISATYPDDQFLAEEGTTNKGDSGLTWIVDPLDGTTNYAHRFPVFCVSIALVKDSVPQAGCI